MKRNLSTIAKLITLMILQLQVSAAPNKPSVELVSNADATNIIKKYQDSQNPNQLDTIIKAIPSTATKEEQNAVIRKLPPQWLAQQNTNADISRNIRKIISPVFELYKKDYTIFFLNNDIPSLMIDSDAVIIITTGLIENLDTDDELIGMTAHEIAHGLFYERSKRAREYLDNLIQAKHLSKSNMI